MQNIPWSGYNRHQRSPFNAQRYVRIQKGVCILMTIQIRTGPQAATYAFNSSRLDTILKAKTLDEAQRMGVFDKLIDRFRGGHKRVAIEKLYQSICAPSSAQNEPAGMLQRFHRLRDMALPEDRALFRTECASPDDQGQWGFSFTIDERTVYVSPPGMRDDEATSFRAFDSAARADRLADMASRLAKSVAERSDAVIGGRTRDDYARGAIDFASDQPEVRALLKAKLHDPLYCSANFRGIEEGDTQDTFRAVFESPAGERTELLLSNRASTEGEFRGAALRNALSQGSYGSLGELFGATFNTSADRQINAFANMSLRLINDELNEEQGTRTTLNERLDELAALKVSAHPDRARLAFDALSGVRLGETTLLDTLLKDRARAVAMHTVLGGVLAPIPGESYDSVRTLLLASEFGERLHDRIGDDPAGELLQGAVRQELGQLARHIGSEGLVELLAAFEKRPELAGLLSLIEGRIMQVLSAEDLDPGMPETDALFVHSHDVRRGARVLSMIAVELQQMARGSNEADRPILAIPDYPPALSRFVEQHIDKRKSAKLAEQLATAAEVADQPIDPRRFA